MLSYISRRLLQAVVVLWLAFTVTFVILYVLPNDPITMAIYGGGDPADVPEELVEKLRDEYGLNDPLWLQYVNLLWAFLRGDLGNSLVTKVPVAQSLAQAIPQTLQLAALGLAIALGLGLALATVAVLVRSNWLRNLLLVGPPLLAALPSFWIALLLLQLFSFKLHLFPASGNDGFQGLVLPALSIGVPGAAVIAQVFYNSLSETLSSPFVETAKAKGASNLRIIGRHGVRLSSIPVLTILGVTFGNLLGGAVIAETIFSRVGLGRLAQQAVTSQDIPVVQAVVVFSAAVFVVVNLIVDLAYPLIDRRITLAAPRLRVRKPSGKELFDVA